MQGHLWVSSQQVYEWPKRPAHETRGAEVTKVTEIPKAGIDSTSGFLCAFVVEGQQVGEDFGV